MHKEKSAFPQSPGIRARSYYIISAHTAEVNQYTTISQELEHLQGWGLHITQHACTLKQYEVHSTLQHLPIPPFKVRDTVWLDAQTIQTTRPSKKLDHRFLGPFPIVEKVSSH